MNIEVGELDAGEQPYRSHLFTVRLWPEELGAGQSEWRGKVQHVLSGETRYFRDWPTLLTHLQTMLPAADSDQQVSGGESTTSDQ
jgi:hypothetical protein